MPRSDCDPKLILRAMTDGRKPRSANYSDIRIIRGGYTIKTKSSPLEKYVVYYSIISSYKPGIAFLHFAGAGNLFTDFELADFLLP